MERISQIVWNEAIEENMPVVSGLFLIAGFEIKNGKPSKVTKTAYYSFHDKSWSCKNDTVVEWWAVLPVLN